MKIGENSVKIMNGERGDIIKRSENDEREETVNVVKMMKNHFIKIESREN